MATPSKGINKKRSADGGITQTPMKIYIDNDLVEYLNAQPNKTRYINTLIRNDLQLHSWQQEVREAKEAPPHPKRRPGRPRKNPDEEQAEQ